MMNFLKILPLLLIIATGCHSNNDQEIDPINELRHKINHIVSDKDATIGVSIIGNNGVDTVSINGNRQFPMQSVFKLHIGLAVLSEIDKGTFSLDQKIEVSKDEILKNNFYSPLRDENPNGGSFTIEKLLQYSVSQSDNLACDILIRLLGSPKAIETYFKKCGIKDIQINFNEEVMQSEWDNMYQNWITPNDASESIRLFYKNEHQLLSKSSFEFIWETCKATTTGMQRIRGLLPSETIVAHKTGTSGTNKETGITGAVNDIGVVFLPNGAYFIISVLVSDSKENFETNERIIAEISKAAYDYFMKVNS